MIIFVALHKGRGEEPVEKTDRQRSKRQPAVEERALTATGGQKRLQGLVATTEAEGRRCCARAPRRRVVEPEGGQGRAGQGMRSRWTLDFTIAVGRSSQPALTGSSSRPGHVRRGRRGAERLSPLSPDEHRAGKKQKSATALLETGPQGEG